MSKTVTILLCGVGGQGALLAADLLARCSIAAGQDVKLSEIHGMSQRGGAVTTVVRFGSQVASMVADEGCADYLLSFETMEALRNISFAKENGCMLVSDTSIKPLPVLTGNCSMPEQINEQLEDAGAFVIPAEELAGQAGSIKAVNVVLLGCLSIFLPFEEDLWTETIKGRVPERFIDINLKAFALGRAWVCEHLTEEQITAASVKLD